VVPVVKGVMGHRIKGWMVIGKTYQEDSGFILSRRQAMRQGTPDSGAFSESPFCPVLTSRCRTTHGKARSSQALTPRLEMIRVQVFAFIGCRMDPTQ
jgi:hypothetical protein